MKLIIFFTTCLLAGLAYSAPASETVPETNDDTLTITEDVFSDLLAVYTSEHDIVKIVNPLNDLNFKEDDDSKLDTIIFFVEADVNENGEYVDRGLYVLKDEQATKLLDNGRDAAAACEETKTAYFAAKDGIYSYNAAENKAEKYGTVTDDLVDIAKVNDSDVIYVLTADNVVYKVTNEGTQKEVVDKIQKAKSIILDYQNNLYYTTSDNEVYVLVGDKVKKIECLPANPTSVTIINPPIGIDNGVSVIVDNKSFVALENGTCIQLKIDFVAKPTAYSMEARIYQYYAYNKKIYEYSIRSLNIVKILSKLASLLADETDKTQSIASKPNFYEIS